MVQFCLTEVSLLLLSLLALLVSSEAREEKAKGLRRNRREWILPPTKLMENTDYTHLTHIAKIRSDKDKDEMVQYFLSGEGADQKPLNLFVVDRITGFVRITGILDRETCPFYNLTGVARYRNGTTAESNIPLTITVLDQNDNAPSIELHTGNITEASNKGTFIMQLKGEDKDQAGTMNAKISYKIVSQEPEGIGHMFNLDESTGKLYVKKPTLDREACDFYKLVIKVTDLGGAAGGLTGTGAVEIKILDINDNIPTLEKSEYSGSVDENVEDVVVMKIKALDKDQEHTDNWLTVFTIAKGNEDNLFSIETDNKTNEGILKLIKAVDFEDVQNLQLGLLIENVAPFVTGSAIEMDVDVQVGEGGPLATGAGVGAGAGVGLGADLGVNVGVDAGVNVDAGLDLEAGIDVGLDAGLKPEAGAAGIKPGVGAGLKPDLKPGPGAKLKPKSPKSYPVKIAVNNLPEGPAFKPSTKNIPVSEDPKEAPQNGVIAVFAATDSDTGKPAEHVSYAKAYDPDNWFTIDEETAEIKINKVPDRESPFLINGTYIGKILAITKDMPPKTATGTIAIQVADSNDHCPTLTTTHTSLCSDEKSVYVTGIDKDVSPNAAPFTFRIIPDGTQGRWVVEVINETSAALHSSGPLWPGPHELQVEVLDAQGLSCPTAEVFTLDVCTCEETKDCRPKTAKLGTTSSKLAAPAIGLLLTASCLLIFIPLLLLLCQCGGADRIFPDKFTELPFNTKEHLISYHTEGRGEDKEMSLQSLPVTLGTLRKVETRRSLRSKTEISKIMETDQIQISNVQRFQGACRDVIEVDDSYTLSGESMNYGNGRATFSRNMLGIQHTTALYEDITLPDAFLSDYYSQKALCAVPAENTLLEYHFEGEGSSAGSVGCCSLLENDSDLHALTDFGPKFKTLADICIPPSVTPKTIPPHNVVGAAKSTAGFVEPVSKSRLGHVVETKHADIKTEKAMSSIIKQQSSVSTVSTAPSMTLPHAKITRMSRSSDVNHSNKLPSPIQTVLIQQQPIYHSRPMLQPMQYVVQPHLQNTLLLVDGSNRSNLFLIQGTENSENPAGSSLPASPTLFIPNSPAVSLGSAEAWKIM